MHKGDLLPIKPHSRLMNWYRWQPLRIPLFNEAARVAMRLKFEIAPIVTKYRKSKTQEEAVTILAQQPMVFGLSTIRSGSTFLADLLARFLPKAQIVHEPNINDYWSYTQVLRSPLHAQEYIATYRKEELAQRLQIPRPVVYGEFNPFLVLHGKALKQQFPKAVFFHLVRDGRSVVRSIMAMEVLGNKDPLTKIILPPTTDPYYEQWSSRSRFEKVCWKWQYENRQLRQANFPMIHFEKVLSSYNYFKDNLLDVIGCEIPKIYWEQYVQQPKHASPHYTIPHWRNWTPLQKNQFEKICGAEMLACGYPIEV